MTLIQLANQIINLDNVSHISTQAGENPPRVVLTFNHSDNSGSGGSTKLFKTILTGAEASAFMALCSVKHASTKLVHARISPADIEKCKNEALEVLEQEKKQAAARVDAFGKTTPRMIRLK